MPIKRIDLLKSSNKISAIDPKELYRLTIKFIRGFSRDTNLNQFDSAIELLTQVKECTTVCLNYIESIDKFNDFEDYVRNLSETLLINFKNFDDLIEGVNKKAIPLFYEMEG